MATILESPKTVTEDKIKDNLVFFQIMREKLEYQKLQAMKEVADAKYKVKSFSRQVREIEKTIKKVKEGKPIKLVTPEPEPPKILKPIEVVKAAQIYDPPRHVVFVKPSVLKSVSPNQVPDYPLYHRNRKCEKCNNLYFPNRKLLKEHISNIHSY